MPKKLSKRFVSAAGLALSASLILGGPALAAAPKPHQPVTHHPVGNLAAHAIKTPHAKTLNTTKTTKNAARPAGQMVTGTVASVSGSVITLTAKNGGSYAVNAASAKIMKSGAAVDVSTIQAGDLLMARGTLSGLSMTATTIVDGVVQKPVNTTEQKTEANKGTHRVMGAISAINGTSLTLTLPARQGQTVVSQTVQTGGSTTVTKDKAAATFADLATGQNVMITGAKDAVTGDFTASQIEIVTHAPTARTMPGRSWNHQK
jgi:hypothetical protein